MSHEQSARLIFAAFARGDVPAILAALSADVEWEYGINSTDVPWYQARRGRAEAAEFFLSLAAVTWYKFEPKAFLAEDDLVVVILDADYAVTANGRRVIYEDAVMVLRFNTQGQVRRFAHRVDLHQAWLAYHA